jgi:hypothetical protein
MQDITNFYKLLTADEDVRDLLGSEETLHKHRFYIELPEALAVAFPGIAPERLQKLQLSSYLYFRYVLGLDSLADGERPATGTVQTTLLFIHEAALTGLLSLIPKENAFWLQLKCCQREYQRALQDEAKARNQRPEWNQDAFELLAVRKSAVSEALVYALHALAPNEGVIPLVLECLRSFHIAAQYEDDMLDFEADWNSKTYTYAHDQLLRYRQAAGKTEELSGRELHQQYYVTGLAAQHLAAARGHYQNAYELAMHLRLLEFGTLVSQHLDHNDELQAKITQQLHEATSRASAQRLTVAG